jgi:hypothetical protein
MPELCPMTGGRVARALVAFVALVCILVSASPSLAQAATSTEVSARKPPPGWDKRVADLVDFVAYTRGLEFKHPVPVRFLTEAEFKERVVADQGDLNRQDKANLEKQVGLWRALGLVEGDAKKLLADMNAVDAAESLAFYDPDKKEIVIRGTQLDVPTRVTVVHELTHVLQDQYFDLNKLVDRSGSDSGRVDALAEGDAVRVEETYLSTLSDSDRAAYGEESDRQSAAAEGALPRDLPAMVEVTGEAPYSLGPAFIEAVAKARGERGVDAAFRTLPVSDKQILDPSAYMAGEGPVPVDPPRLVSGETRLGKDETLGAFGLYLMLAGRIDPSVALPTIDAWGGDAMVEFTRGGKVCMRAAVVGRDAAGLATIAAALDQWAALGPLDAGSVERANDAAIVTACDPGQTPADTKITDAGDVLAARSSVLAGEIQHGASLEGALCVADRASLDPGLRNFLHDATGTDDEIREFRRRTTNLEATCGA